MTQRHASIHAFFSVTILAGPRSGSGLGPLEWATLIIFAIAMVWTAEFLNTALEAVVDLASPDLHQLARVGKDVGGGRGADRSGIGCADWPADPGSAAVGEDRFLGEYGQLYQQI